MGSAQMQSELWGAFPEDWVALQEPGHIPLFAAMLEAANIGNGTNLLDVGCGGGTSSKLAADRGAQVSGLDATPTLVDIARERVPSGNFRVGDMETLPYNDDRFDVVIAANALQYAANRIVALREWHRVCNPDAKVVVGLFGPAEGVAYRAVFSAVRDALPEPPPGAGPFELSEPGVLEALIAEAGFTVQGSSEVDCPFKFSDLDSFWRGAMSGGPIQRARRALGDDTLKSVLGDAAAPFRNDDGSYTFSPNYFKYVVATVPAQ